MPPIKVLYLGMGRDIMSALELVPDLDVLYVIDQFDVNESNDETIHGQMEEIIDVIKTGKKRASYDGSGEGPASMRQRLTSTDIHYLSRGKGEIMASMDYHGKAEGVECDWRLRFRYGGKERTLFRWNQDFLKDWPEDITGVKHVMMMGSFSFDVFMSARISPHDRGHFLYNMTTRTVPGYRLYAYSYDHAFDNHIVIKSGISKKGTFIAYKDINRHLPLIDIIEAVREREVVKCKLFINETGQVYEVKWRK